MLLHWLFAHRVLLNNASPLNNPENAPEKWQRAADAAQDVLDLPEYQLVSMANYKRLFIGAFRTDISENNMAIARG